MGKKKKQSTLSYEQVMALSKTDLKKLMRKLGLPTIALEKDLRKNAVDHLKLSPPTPPSPSPSPADDAAKEGNGDPSETKDTVTGDTGTTAETREQPVLALTQPVAGQSKPAGGEVTKDSNVEASTPDNNGGTEAGRDAGKTQNLTREQVDNLNGKALSEHLKAAGLAVSGKVAEKREKLLKHHGLASAEDVDADAGSEKEVDEQAKSKDTEAKPKKKLKSKSTKKVTKDSNVEASTPDNNGGTEAGRDAGKTQNLTREQVDNLNGKALSEHLKAAGLAVSGKVAEKREKLLKHHGLASAEDVDADAAIDEGLDAADSEKEVDEQAKSKDAEAKPKKKLKSKSAKKVTKDSNVEAGNDSIEAEDAKEQPQSTSEAKKPKRPLSGYNKFISHMREETKKEVMASLEGDNELDSKARNSAVFKALGAKWKALSDEEKLRWNAMEQPQSRKGSDADAPSTSSPPVAGAKDGEDPDAKEKGKKRKGKKEKDKKKSKKRKEKEMNTEDAIDATKETQIMNPVTLSPDVTTIKPAQNSPPTKKIEKDSETGKEQMKKRKKADKKAQSESAKKVTKDSNVEAGNDSIEAEDAKEQPQSTSEAKKPKRPLSGYNKFISHMREETKKEVMASLEGDNELDSKARNSAVFKALGAKWKALSDEERLRWNAMEQPQSRKGSDADAPSTSSPPVAGAKDGEDPDAKEKKQKRKRKRKSKGKSDVTETGGNLPNPVKSFVQSEGRQLQGHVAAVDTPLDKSTGEEISWTDDLSRFDFRCSHISYLSELSTQDPIDNFFKGAKWSPDGFLLLTASNDNCVRMFETPVEPSELVPASSPTDSVSELSQVGEHTVGGLIYDYAWYSRMATIDAASCCYAVSSRGNPVHLLDGATHKLRCTYKAHDSADELVSANSLSFHPDGELLVCGYKRSIVEFNLARPGKSDHAHSTLESGQRGIISTIDFSPAAHSFVACGCYDGTIGFYDMNSGWGKSVQTLLGHDRGVTQVMFDRYGNYVYSGGRRDDFIHCWDTRFVTDHPVYSLKRLGVTSTNQTIEFDIDPLNKYLVSGGVSGTASVFDLNDGKQVREVSVAEPGVAANGISINQSSRWSLYLAVSCGNYQFDRGHEAVSSLGQNSLKLYNICRKL